MSSEADKSSFGSSYLSSSSSWSKSSSKLSSSSASYSSSPGCGSSSSSDEEILAAAFSTVLLCFEHTHLENRKKAHGMPRRGKNPTDECQNREHYASLHGRDFFFRHREHQGMDKLSHMRCLGRRFIRRERLGEKNARIHICGEARYFVQRLHATI